MELSRNSLLWKFLCLSMDGWDQRSYTERGMIDGCTLITYFLRSLFSVILCTIIFSVLAGGIYLLSIVLYALDAGIEHADTLLTLSFWQQIPVVLYGICLAISIVILAVSAFQVGRWIAKLFRFKDRPSVLVQSFKAKSQSFCLPIKIK